MPPGRWRREFHDDALTDLVCGDALAHVLAVPRDQRVPLEEHAQVGGVRGCPDEGGDAVAELKCGKRALLEKSPNPSETEVRYWLAGNLCRCTGYDKIVRAVLDAAAEMRGA